MDIKLIAIAAMDRQRIIGYQNSIPWHISADLKRFSVLTRGHSVLMGRKTFESLPENNRPLRNRLNIILTRSPETFPQSSNLIACSSIEGLLCDIRSGVISLPSELIWIIGGAEVYRLSQPLWDEVFLTLVEGEHQGDTFFPPFEDDFTLEASEPNSGYCFLKYVRSKVLRT